MNKVLVTTALVLGVAGSAGAAGDVRARAAKDLGCPAKSVRIQSWEGGSKVEAQGCGRNATYENGELTMVELAPSAEMRRQASQEIGCVGSDLLISRTAYPQQGTDTLDASGCGGEVHYDVIGGGTSWKLTLKLMPAAPDLAAKVAADLKCDPGTLKVMRSQDGQGEVTVGANDCHSGSFVKYRPEPFARLVAPSVATTTTETVPTTGDGADTARVNMYKQQAGKDLACDAANVQVTLHVMPNGDLSSVDAEGCGRHAKYQQRGGAGGVTLTFLEQKMQPSWQAQVAHDMECSPDKVEAHVYSFPDKGSAVTMGAKGCDREASYQVQSGGPKLLYILGKAPADVVAKIAKDLHCEENEMKVDLVRRDARGPWSATGKSCHDGSTWLYSLDPFRRIAKQ